MLSKTDVANLALGYMAVSASIVDLDTDNFSYSKILRRFFQTAINTFLEKHPWNIASKNAELALIQENPGSGYAFEYAFPADALVIREVAPELQFNKEYEQYEYEKLNFEERLSGSSMTIHTDLKNAFVEYTRKLPLDQAFPEYFGRGLAAQWAKECANQIITNNYAKVKDVLMSDLDNKISEAIAVDISRSPRKKDPLSPFITARF